MASLRTAALAGALACLLPTAAALAADYPEPPVIEYPVPVEIGSNWYLRGDIGLTAQRVGSIYNVLYETATYLYEYERTFDPSYSVGLGFGYRYNEHFRVDFTGEYRGPSDFYGYDTYDTDGDGTIDGDDEYTAYKTEYTFLANAYFDLFTWGSITPFVGAGAGLSYNIIHDFVDTNIMNASYATGETTGTWSFAWAFYAGLGWQISPKMTMEVAYRYLNLGDAESGDLVSGGVNSVHNPMEFNGLTSHDVKVGLRYAIW